MNSTRRCCLTQVAIARTNAGSSKPQTPHSGNANGFVGCALYSASARRPRCAVTADVVEVVADHVDVRVARVVRLCGVTGKVRLAEALRVPDDAQLRRRHGQVARDAWQPELREPCVDLRPRAAAHDHGDACERLAVPECRVRGVAQRSIRVVRAGRFPVGIHLRERPHVEAVAGPRVDDGVQLEEKGVVLPRCDAARRRRLVLPVRARVEREERHRPHRRDDPPQRVALREAHERVVDRALLAGLRGEAPRVAADAEHDACVSSGDEGDCDGGDYGNAHGAARVAPPSSGRCARS